MASKDNSQISAKIIPPLNPTEDCHDIMVENVIGPPMSFFKRIYHNYAPIIVFVPGIILIHAAWFKLQENDLFVPPDDRVLHPSILEIPTMFKELKNRYFPPKEKEPENASD